MDQDVHPLRQSGGHSTDGPAAAGVPLADLFSVWFREAQVRALRAGKARSTAPQVPPPSPANPPPRPAGREAGGRRP